MGHAVEEHHVPVFLGQDLEDSDQGPEKSVEILSLAFFHRATVEAVLDLAKLAPKEVHSEDAGKG